METFISTIEASHVGTFQTLSRPWLGQMVNLKLKLGDGSLHFIPSLFVVPVTSLYTYLPFPVKFNPIQNGGRGFKDLATISTFENFLDI